MLAEKDTGALSKEYSRGPLVLPGPRGAGRGCCLGGLHLPLSTLPLRIHTPPPPPHFFFPFRHNSLALTTMLLDTPTQLNLAWGLTVNNKKDDSWSKKSEVCMNNTENRPESFWEKCPGSGPSFKSDSRKLFSSKTPRPRADSPGSWALTVSTAHCQRWALLRSL